MSIEINVEDLQELVEENSPSLVIGGVRLRNIALLDADEFDRYEKLLRIGKYEDDSERGFNMGELLERYTELFILLAGGDTPKVRKVLESVTKVPGGLVTLIAKYFKVTQVGEA